MSEADFDLSTLKKKKKSKSVEPESSTASEDLGAGEEFLTGLKKKKKKSKKVEEGKNSDDVSEIQEGLEELNFGPKKSKSKSKSKSKVKFDEELEKAGLAKTEEGEGKVDKDETNESVSANDSLSYEFLLERFFNILKENNPELAGERSNTKLKIPPPIVSREPKKTIFSNVKEISQRLQRDPEHVIQYLFAELGTSGSIDAKEQLIIKGKFMQKQLEYVLKKYIIEYVTCKTCKSINTKLVRENANRLYFLVCNSCGSSRSVSSIKTGFQASLGKRKKV